MCDLEMNVRQRCTKTHQNVTLMYKGLRGATRVHGRLVLGDVVQRFNGKEVQTQQDLFAAIDECKVGQTVKVDVLRNGSTKTVSVTLAERVRE